MSKRCELGDDLVEEILLRLPAKSLARFKCVSRTWRDLISERRFCRKHSERAQKKILVVRTKDVFAVRIGHLVNNTFKPFMGLQMVNFLRHFGSVTEASHCDGLFCLGFRDETQPLLVWNPTTTETLTVRTPWLRSYGKRIRGESPRFIGLGYDNVIGDYKIVSFLTKPLKGKVLALKSGVWRDIDMESVSARLVLPCQQCISFDGKVLWLGSKNDPTNRAEKIVLCFDLVTERFSELAAPPFSSRMNPSCLRLVEGNLCALELGLSKKKIQMWVTKDLGVHWNEAMTLSAEAFPDTGLLPSLPGLMSFTNRGELLISLNNEEREEFYMYNTKAKKFRRVVTRSCIKGFPFIYEFASSLVSLQGSRKREREE